ncbi:tetratricopeptide repeat protein [Streptomyces caniscabiei]|uniref:tetratricopeptide repeat protein n=1 Tax=Streptomyces caniscabiei TaxID=2746961 RepID=UPI0029BA2265|nr:tetratricopeptide repeat protein [Streptomyces caniscabiei]MDX2775961.1 tetratricopeptide repeat protein [Streptomyces caniscabiei]
MLGLLLVVGFGVWALFKPQTITEVATDLPQKISEKLDRLWEVAQESLREKKYLRAEKALLTILRVDERNATAYNRLGILYAKQQAFKDAIECFEIAQSLEPSASSLHNVGLIYFETGQYEKAALAFEQALAMEDDVASRHIAYAKVQEKLGRNKKMIESLERAVALDPIPQTLNILADAYDRNGQVELATELREKASKLIIPPGQPKTIRQNRRVVM